MLVNDHNDFPEILLYHIVSLPHTTNTLDWIKLNKP